MTVLLKLVIQQTLQTRAHWPHIAKIRLTAIQHCKLQPSMGGISIKGLQKQPGLYKLISLTLQSFLILQCMSSHGQKLSTYAACCAVGLLGQSASLCARWVDVAQWFLPVELWQLGTEGPWLCVGHGCAWLWDGCPMIRNDLWLIWSMRKSSRKPHFGQPGQMGKSQLTISPSGGQPHGCGQRHSWNRWRLRLRCSSASLALAIDSGEKKVGQQSLPGLYTIGWWQKRWTQLNMIEALDRWNDGNFEKHKYNIICRIHSIDLTLGLRAFRKGEKWACAVMKPPPRELPQWWRPIHSGSQAPNVWS